MVARWYAIHRINTGAVDLAESGRTFCGVQRQNAPLIWFLLEGAGILATVGFFLTGVVASAIAMGVAIVIYWLSGPKDVDEGMRAELRYKERP